MKKSVKVETLERMITKVYKLQEEIDKMNDRLFTEEEQENIDENTDENQVDLYYGISSASAGLEQAKERLMKLIYELN